MRIIKTAPNEFRFEYDDRPDAPIKGYTFIYEGTTYKIIFVAPAFELDGYYSFLVVTE